MASPRTTKLLPNRSRLSNSTKRPKSSSRSSTPRSRHRPSSTYELEGNPYYEWIVEGLRLYEALAREPVEVIECFPTASWTRWHGSRDGRRRAAWTREALAALELEGVPSRTNQDKRDAIAAALTARDYHQGHFDAFGDIIVPIPA